MDEGIAQNIYSERSIDFFGAGQRRLADDMARLGSTNVAKLF
jgi:hypothetical protein